MSIGWPSRTTVTRIDLAGPVLLDLGQQLLDGMHPLVVDGDDQVGGVGIEERRMKPGRLLDPDLDAGWMPGLLGRSALDQRARPAGPRRWRDAGDPQVGPDDPAVRDQRLEDPRGCR